jgi:hypothetical protein
VTEATKEITGLVKGIQGDTYDAVVAMEESTKEVVRGSTLADEAGKALQSIYSSVERQARIVEDIGSAASERQRTAEAVAYSMSQIAEIARQTNAATQDASQSVSYLADLAEQLRASVATFRLPERIAEQAGLPAQSEGQFAAPAQLGSGASGARWEVPADALIGAGIPSGGFGGAGQPGTFGYDAYSGGYDGGYNGYGAPADSAIGSAGQSAYSSTGGPDTPWAQPGEAPYPPDQYDGRY